MDEAALGRALFGFYYQGVNLIHLVQHGRADPENVRKLIQESLASAKTVFPQHVAGLEAAAAEFEGAIRRGLDLKEKHEG